MRRCLIVSPYFPPSNLAGAHRARHLVKHLPAHGWEATVVCVDPIHHIERSDHGLRALVPTTARIIETGALPARWTAPFGLRGDIGLRAYFHLRAAVHREIALARPDVVLITGAPFFPMLLCPGISRRFGVPVVLDFQDPWASKEGATRSRWTKGWLAHRLAVEMEPRALAGAAWVTSVSERQNAELTHLYPWLDQKRMSAIPIGGDPADYDAFRDERPVALSNRATCLTFSYVGTALPRATSLLATLFDGLLLLRQRQPHLTDQLRLRFVGTSNQPASGGTFRVLPLAQAAGVADLIVEEPGRVAFLDALRILAGTHAVLMIGSDEPHYTASKIYPALMCGRPFLSIFHQASSAHQILARTFGGVAIAWSPEKKRETLAAEVAGAFVKLLSDPDSLGERDSTAYAKFSAHAVAGQYAEVFERSGE